MTSLLNSISAFIGRMISISLISGSLVLVAGEIRLAALKKASQGTSKLSGFTQKMTKMNVNRIIND